MIACQPAQVRVMMPARRSAQRRPSATNQAVVVAAAVATARAVRVNSDRTPRMVNAAKVPVKKSPAARTVRSPRVGGSRKVA